MIHCTNRFRYEEVFVHLVVKGEIGTLRLIFNCYSQFSSVLKQYQDVEYGFSVLNIVIRKIWPNTQFFLFVTSLLILGLHFNYICENSKNIALSIIIFLCLILLILNSVHKVTNILRKQVEFLVKKSKHII